MKNNNIKIAVVEEGNFYNNLVESQICELCDKMNFKKLNWVIKSYENINSFLKETNSVFQAFIIDSYSGINKKKEDGNCREFMEEIKQRNKDCLFITISGHREMVITAEFYKEGELCLYYMKQSNVVNKDTKSICSVPTVHKLMDKLLTYVQKKTENVISHNKRVSHKLRISA